MHHPRNAPDKEERKHVSLKRKILTQDQGRRVSRNVTSIGLLVKGRHFYQRNVEFCRVVEGSTRIETARHKGGFPMGQPKNQGKLSEIYVALRGGTR